MPIDQVLLSNTFNEFRITVNNIANAVNAFDSSISTDDLTANTISTDDLTANTITVGEISSNLIPDANLTYDLGTATNRWRDLYLSGNTIFLGAAEISYDGSKVVFEVGGLEIFDTSNVVANLSNLDASNVTTGTLNANRLANSGAVAGTYGGVTEIPVIVVDAKGRITSVSNTSISVGGGIDSVTYYEGNTNLVVVTTDANTFTTAITLANTAVTAGTYGSASQVPVLVIDEKGRITSASNTNVAGVTAFNYFSANTNLVINTADGGTFTAGLGASSANGASTIVARDATGSFSANAITATTVTATTFFGEFVGDGSQLTGLGAAEDLQARTLAILALSQ
jgi:hypothetical protein